MEKLNTQKFVLCRSLYCQECADANRPSGNEIIALYKKSTKKYRILYPDQYTVPQLKKRSGNEIKEPGLTPHLIFNIREIDNHFTSDTLCLVHGCGVSIDEKYLQHENFLEIELSMKDTIIQMQTLLLTLQGLLLKADGLTIREKELRSEILDTILYTQERHIEVLENNFSPGEYGIEPITTQEKKFTKKEFFSLMSNDPKFYPRNIIIKEQ